MPIPNYLADVEAAKVKYADAWSHAHVEGDPRKHEWIKLFAADLHAKDPKAGLNGKRGNPNDLSMDTINYLCEASDSAGRTPEGLPCAVVDVIGGAGAIPPYTPQNPAPKPVWSPFTTNVEGSGAWVKPTGSAPGPQPVQPYPDEQEWWPKVFDVEVGKRYQKAGITYPDNARAFRWASRTAYDIRAGMTKEASLEKHLRELEQELSQ